ncbi:MAG: DUF2784 domain-containing protein [Xanthomonadales bacterium]|nr:DUF2784 domain-containing protein [Xanthomonadales bacterium]
MPYKLAADLLVLIHFGFIIFVVMGGLLVFRWPKVAWAHIPAVAWGAWIELSHGVCPLTPLEQSLRNKAGTDSYDGSFIDHYIIPLIYPPGFDPQTATLLGLSVLSLNLVVYSAIAYRRFFAKARKGSISP